MQQIVTAARAIQSEETGFIHSYYGRVDPPHQAVSLEDNLLFVLALCRLKTVEAIQEAKILLEKLLAYQSPAGLFPSYLHEFPFCPDPYRGASLLPPLFSIYHYFHHVLGASLTKSLREAIEKLLNALIPEFPHLSLTDRFRIGGALLGMGHEEGKRWLDIKAFLNSPSRFIPKHLGEAYSGAVMAPGGEVASQLMGWMKTLWHPQLCTYSGPFLRIDFFQGEKEVTLYDLYMGKESPLLKGALVFPHELKVASVEVPSYSHQEDQLCFSWLPMKGQYPFAFQWKGGHLVLYAQEANVSCDGKGILDITMGKAPLMDSKDSGREILWYLSQHLKMSVNGQAATTFRLNDDVCLEDENIAIHLVFEAEEGRFQGHFSKAQAPTEKICFGKHRFHAYHSQILWRTILRPDFAPLRIRFSYASKH